MYSLKLLLQQTQEGKMSWVSVNLQELENSPVLNDLLGGFPHIQEFQDSLLDRQSQTIRHFKTWHLDSHQKKKVLFYSLSIPRVKGGTYDNSNLEVFKKVIGQAHEEEHDVLYILYLNTGGVRITHDRSIFDPIWSIMPELYKLRKKHLLITLAHEKCLGAGAVFFAQGTFRLAIGAKTILNLTGPSIIKSFYGQGNESPKEYEEYASVEHQWQKNELIQEAYLDWNSANQRISNLLSFLEFSPKHEPSAEIIPLEKKDHPDIFPKSKIEHDKLLRAISDESFEIFPSLSPIGKTYILKKKDRYYGALLQPMKNPDNMINRAMVRRYEMSVDLFQVLKIPLVSGIDSPGGDPRQKESDHDILLASVDLVEKLTQYPFPKMGLVLKRSFGGSGMFALPPSHGSVSFIALKESDIGIMSNGLLDKVVESRPSLKIDWEKTKQKHLPEMQDLIILGTVDAVVELPQLSHILDHFLEVHEEFQPKSMVDLVILNKENNLC